MNPYVTDDDADIINWARARGLDRYPIAYVDLVSVNPDGANLAKIDFWSIPATMQRVKAPRPPKTVTGNT